jgi:hypothetical protein
MLPWRAAIRQTYNARYAALPFPCLRYTATFSKVRPGKCFLSSQSQPVAIKHIKNKPAPDTIFALSTAPGKAGVGVIRISGTNAEQVRCRTQF